MKLAVPSHSPSSVSSVRPFSERWRAGWLTAWALLVGALVALPVLAVISHVLSTGEDNVTRLGTDRLAAKQTRKFRLGENCAKVFYGFEGPVTRILDMFGGQL